MSTQPAPQPTSIRLQILDPTTTPGATYTELFHLLAAAFGGSGPIWENMYPPPRPALDEQARVGARQHAWEIKNRDLVYVVALGSFPSPSPSTSTSNDHQEPDPEHELEPALERPVGLAVWGKPGYRWTPLPLTPSEMQPQERQAYEGYNLAFRNEWRGTLQRHRDLLMRDQPYWCVLVLHLAPPTQPCFRTHQVD